MFDIGFTEILVIGGVALFVIGPERLPQTVRDISLWVGRLKRGLRETRQELEQQIGADEIRRTLHNENVLQGLHNIKRDVNETLNQKIDFDDEEEDYELPPHDPNNDDEDLLDDSKESAVTESLKPTKPTPTAAPTVTAEALVRGEIPFETAAESAAAEVAESQEEQDADSDSEPEEDTKDYTSLSPDNSPSPTDTDQTT